MSLNKLNEVLLPLNNYLLAFNWPQLIFISTAVVVLIAATGLCLVRDAVKAVILLLVVLVASALMWLCCQAEFLALSLVIIYVGAVVVLFLFVVMLLGDSSQVATINSKNLFLNWRFLLPALLAVIWLFACYLILKADLISFVQQTWLNLKSSAIATTEPLTAAGLGRLMFSQYLIHIELAACLLLATIVSVLTLLLNKPVKLKNLE